MRLTAEFEAAKKKILRQEELMEIMLDETLNQKRQHLNDISDYYFEQHMQEIANLYTSISDRIDYLYTVPITKASKSYLQMHLADIKKIEPALVKRIEIMEEESKKQILAPEHQTTVSKVIIGFAKMADGHRNLVKNFAQMIKDQQNGSAPPQP